jgi:hypothetical protein
MESVAQGAITFEKTCLAWHWRPGGQPLNRGLQN